MKLRNYLANTLKIMSLYTKIIMVYCCILTLVAIFLVPVLLASSGGSVEGYCAGEKEVLDAFNRWVSVFPRFPCAGPSTFKPAS